MIKRLCWFVSVAALCAEVSTSSLAIGQEWTRFHGPNGTGVAQGGAGIPSEWKESDLNWKAELPGLGHSSPVIWGDKIFLLSADPDTAERYMVCISAADGSQLWVRKFASEKHHLHTRSSFASCTPVVDKDRVYVAWSEPSKITLIAFTHDGETVWERDLGTWVSQHGFGTSPIIYGEKLIMHVSQQARQLKPGEKPGDSKMYAFDRNTGKTLWTTPLTSVNVCYSVPFIYEKKGQAPQIICTDTGEGVFSIDPETGKMNWKAGELSMRTVASPIEAAGLIFGSTGSGGGGNYVIAVKPGPAAKQEYEFKSTGAFRANYVPTPVAKGNLVFSYYDKGFANCINAATGEVVWSERINAPFSGSIIRIGDRLFGISEEGEVVVLSATEKFKVLGRTQLGEDSRSTPAVADGRLYLRTYSHLFSVGGNSSGGK